ncbi:putative glycosyltransferase EpsD [bioreactor metagenome]|uniref:Putative glycosyltransferase EpsD n=1 Tax=bioreactor metagenome TaxID=1076179 RepID=A0A645GKB2_9ZZZZ
MANAHLLLAGDGKTLNECKQLVKQLGQTNKIHFLGYVNDVTRLYAFCDAAVSPSLSEGLPFNIIEAMGCGLPVIVSDIKGHRELAEQSINGLLFHKKNQQELINCLKEMYFFDYEQRLLLGQAGIKKAEAFSLESVFNKIMNIYQNNLKDCTSREIGQCDLD